MSTIRPPHKACTRFIQWYACAIAVQYHRNLTDSCIYVTHRAIEKVLIDPVSKISMFK